MSRDLSEYIDDYCSDTYGHTNWGFKKAYTQNLLNEKKSVNSLCRLLFEYYFKFKSRCRKYFGLI